MSLIVASAEAFQENGTTSLGVCTNARNIKWREALGERGAGSFEVPATVATSLGITGGCIVKFSVLGSVRFAIRIVSEVTQVATDGTKWTRFENQPGLLSLLDDAYTEPEYGLTRAPGSERVCGFMSDGSGPWYVAGNWGTPYTDICTGSTYSAHLPPVFVHPAPYFLDKNPIGTSEVADAEQWFRGSFTLASPATLGIYATADDIFDLYIDGELVLQNTRRDINGWHYAFFAPKLFLAGTHTVAAHVTNVPGGTPMSFLFALSAFDDQNNPTGSPYLISDSSWKVWTASGAPGWSAGAVLKTLFDEANARSDRGTSHLSLGFTATTDSNSTAWVNTGEFRVPILSETLADTALRVSEQYAVDVWADASTMTLQAAGRRGTDRSGTVTLTAGPGGSLKSFETSKTYALRTVIGVQLSGGDYIEVVDSAGVTTYGRIEAGASVGTVSDATTATGIANTILAQSTNPPVVITNVDTSSLATPLGYQDYFVGDSITGPGNRGVGTLKYRVVALNVDFSQDVIRIYPELMEDRT